MMLLEQQSEKEGAEQIDFERVRPSDSSVQPTHSLTPRVGLTSHDPGSLAPSDAGRPASATIRALSQSGIVILLRYYRPPRAGTRRQNDRLLGSGIIATITRASETLDDTRPVNQQPWCKVNFSSTQTDTGDDSATRRRPKIRNLTHAHR